ncbi:MAG: alpha/beta hydrolase [Myxococcota bacterium]
MASLTPTEESPTPPPATSTPPNTCLASALGWIGLPFTGGALLVGLMLPASFPTLVSLFGGVLVAVGLATAPWRWQPGSRLRGLSRAALALIVVAQFIRMLPISGVSGQVWPYEGNLRGVLHRLVDEQDIAMLGTRVLVAAGQLSSAESKGLAPAMAERYQAMFRTDGVVPTPLLSTAFGLQHPEAFDTLVIEPMAEEAPSRAVVFLHGYAGNFTLPCWQIAQAARLAGAVTVCPSVGLKGDWWTPQGQATVEATLDRLKARGITSVVLAGLSNGGIGASLLAPRLAARLDGVVLISGVSARAKPTRLPTLVIHGAGDTMTLFAVARRYARRGGRRNTLVRLKGRHFALMTEHEAATQALTSWLQALPQD